jgi:hypothetical protein
MYAHFFCYGEIIRSQLLTITTEIKSFSIFKEKQNICNTYVYQFLRTIKKKCTRVYGKYIQEAYLEADHCIRQTALKNRA